jgi:hypothetical protein
VTQRERDTYAALRRAKADENADRSFWAVATVGGLVFFAACLIVIGVWYAGT